MIAEIIEVKFYYDTEDPHRKIVFVNLNWKLIPICMNNHQITVDLIDFDFDFDWMTDFMAYQSKGKKKQKNKG